MDSFLHYVAKYIFHHYGNDLAHVAVVFPNKRAALFLNEELRNIATRPIWSPAYVTISDLFRSYSPLTVADPITSVVELYNSYVSITGRAETLDHFFGWGQLLLADFDDIDKNMASADDVFRNLRDLHEMDSISYLTQEQKALLKRFFSNFVDDDSVLQQRFLYLWSNMKAIYDDFRTHLRSKSLAYEGMLYRDVAEKQVIDLEYKHYVFVGFNVLQKVEQQLFRKIKEEGKADFFWDYDEYYLYNKEAGTYIKQYLTPFPNALENHADDIYNRFADPKEINLVSASTDDIQCRYISTWLSENNRYKAGNRTAIVLCNENLLQTAIHCIPKEMGDGDKLKVNITTGFPLSLTPIASLVEQLLVLQTEGYAQRQQGYRLHYVKSILRHPHIAYITPLASTLMETLISHRVFYAGKADLCLDEGLALLFTHYGNELNIDKWNSTILEWLMEIVKLVAMRSQETADNLFGESAFRMYTLLNKLHTMLIPDADSSDALLHIDKITLLRLIHQLIGTTSVPFHGEPAIGIQLMGVLETRNLDFDHLLILSCNEGFMPKGVDDSSFLPHAIRKAFSLTTIDNKVAIYSYYFYSMIQRAKDVTIVYNSSTQGMSTGEMSRFMLQLLVESKQNIHQWSLSTSQAPTTAAPQPIAKDESVMQRLNAFTELSPTAINRYIRCQLAFYYCYIAGLKEPDETDDDDVDNRLFGNIFHRAAQLMYEQLLPQGIIGLKDIERAMKSNSTPIVDGLGRAHSISAIISQAFAEEFFKLPKGTQKHPPLNGLQLINEHVLERYLLLLLENDKRLIPFQIMGQEEKVSTVRTIGERKITIGGRIDRLDRICQNGVNRLRVVDYKTGSKQAGAIADIGAIFNADNIRKSHTDYILQAMLYALITSGDAEHNPDKLKVSPNLLFIQHAKAKDYNPAIVINSEPVTDVEPYREDFHTGLTQVLTSIFSKDIPFAPTVNTDFCTTCPYKQLCGRIL